MINNQHGLFSTVRKYHCKTDETVFICQDFLKYISLDKLGSNNDNFAAALINGHGDIRICEQLLQQIAIKLNADILSHVSVSEDIKNYIEKILSEFEEKFLTVMSELAKMKELKLRKMSDSKHAVKDKQQLEEIDDMENQLKSGATVAIVAVIYGHIYVYNIGDNQVILVSNDDSDSKQKFILLTDEQSFYNDKEIQRIKEDCGLDPDALRWLSSLSTERCHSRCIGDFEFKLNFDKFDALREAKSSPLISIPQKTKCIALDKKFTHILLISSGLYYLVCDLIYDRDKVHGEISRKFFEIRDNDLTLSLNELCKRVVESFVSEHKDCHDRCVNLITETCNFSEYTHYDDLSVFAMELTKYLGPELLVVHDSDNGVALVDSSDTTISDGFDYVDGRDSTDAFKDQFATDNTPLTAYVDFTCWPIALTKLTPDELAFIDSIVESNENYDDTITEEIEIHPGNLVTTL